MLNLFKYAFVKVIKDKKILFVIKIKVKQEWFYFDLFHNFTYLTSLF